MAQKRDRYAYRTPKTAAADGPFAQLKSLLAQTERTKGPGKRVGKAEAAKKTPPEETPPEERVFRAAMAGVREIPEFTRLGVKTRGRRPQPRRNADSDFGGALLAEHELDLSLIDEYVEWRAPDQPRDIPRRLHQGVFSVQDSLDLHGMTREEALRALSLFVRDVRKRGLSCIKVIHGRGLRSPGEPVLRSAVREWFARGPDRRRVRAFATAPNYDGGLGALYVLLKKR